MPREKREIVKNDIMPLDVYTKQRKELRKNIVVFKKDRRIALGPYATFYFELRQHIFLPLCNVVQFELHVSFLHKLLQ